MAKPSRILRTVGNGPNSVLRAHTSDQNVPARVVMDAKRQLMPIRIEHMEISLAP